MGIKRKGPIRLCTIHPLLPGFLLLDPWQWFKKQPSTLNSEKGKGSDILECLILECLVATHKPFHWAKLPHESLRAADLDRGLGLQGQLTKSHRVASSS